VHLVNTTFSLTLLLLLSSTMSLYAASSTTTGELNVNYEELTLPAGERMGMVELGVLHDFTENLSVGIGSWMAVKGERGGFITLGVDGVFRYPLTQQLDVVSGIYVGAGGGRGGYTLSGGGLMLRTYAALTYNVRQFGTLGVGVSSVDFPDGGTIHSTQPFLSYSLPFTSSLENGWDRYEQASPKSSIPKAHSLALVTRHLQVSPAVATDTGGAQGDFTLLGVEWRTQLNRAWYAKLETEGAAGGSSAGYMQILAGGGYRIPLMGNLFANADLSLGAGGGGGVDSGGGLLFDAAVGVEYFLTRHLFANLSAGYLSASTGSFEANTLAFKLGYKTGVESDERVSLKPAYLRVRAVNQSYSQASDQWRSHHASQSVNNLGLQIDYLYSDEWYATGQGLAAYQGSAGAYMTGLVGTGIRKAITRNFYLNAEALAGAAGGGGLAMGSGLVWQGNAGVGYEINPSLSALVTAGRMEAFNGNFKANVLGLSVAWQFKSYLKQ
jgi:hypothetical protein